VLITVAFRERSPIKALTGTSPAQRYVAEFEQAERRYPDGPREGDGTGSGAEVRLESDPRGVWLPLVNDSCHSVWLRSPGAKAKRILRLGEGDPGSGSSFGFGWSRDGRAVFIYGDHSGFDCPWFGQPYQQLRIIYTLEDGIDWELPRRKAA
jgi:hypothetical protein